MSVDETLLLGRVVLVAALYLFLIILGVLLWREVSARATTSEERAPGDLLVIEPYETGYDTGERVPLLAVSTIGRSNENAIILEDTFVSSEHARLFWNGKGWVLEDLGSTNGTQVNGQRVKRAAAVRPGDVIEFGRVKTKLVPL